VDTSKQQGKGGSKSAQLANLIRPMRMMLRDELSGTPELLQFKTAEELKYVRSLIPILSAPAMSAAKQLASAPQCDPACAEELKKFIVRKTAGFDAAPAVSAVIPIQPAVHSVSVSSSSLSSSSSSASSALPAVICSFGSAPQEEVKRVGMLAAAGSDQFAFQQRVIASMLSSVTGSNASASPADSTTTISSAIRSPHRQIVPARPIVLTASVEPIMALPAITITDPTAGKGAKQSEVPEPDLLGLSCGDSMLPNQPDSSTLLLGPCDQGNEEEHLFMQSVLLDSLGQFAHDHLPQCNDEDISLLEAKLQEEDKWLGDSPTRKRGLDEIMQPHAFELEKERDKPIPEAVADSSATPLGPRLIQRNQQLPQE
jgi:hypothetical protein